MLQMLAGVRPSAVGAVACTSPPDITVSAVPSGLLVMVYAPLVTDIPEVWRGMGKEGVQEEKNEKKKRKKRDCQNKSSQSLNSFRGVVFFDFTETQKHTHERDTTQ